MKPRKKGKIVLVTGGARSGKSTFAVKLARASGGKVVFIATCEPKDDELRERVKSHRKERPKEWKTFEAGDMPFQPDWEKIPKNTQVLLVDCLTFWAATLVMRGASLYYVRRKLASFLSEAVYRCKDVIIVTNEVGFGIVPQNELSRRFRDVVGKINQETAKRAEQVFFVMCGVPVEMKQFQHDLTRSGNGR